MNAHRPPLGRTGLRSRLSRTVNYPSHKRYPRELIMHMQTNKLSEVHVFTGFANTGEVGQRTPGERDFICVPH